MAAKKKAKAKASGKGCKEFTEEELDKFCCERIDAFEKKIVAEGKKAGMCPTRVLLALARNMSWWMCVRFFLIGRERAGKAAG